MSTPAASFRGLSVAGFESRRAEELARMIARAGGVPSISPSMREVGLADNPAALDFARRLVAGEFDVVIHMTGVGIEQLLKSVESTLPREEVVAALGRVVTLARGPKPVAVLKELGLSPTIRAAEPNTWREIVAALDGAVGAQGGSAEGGGAAGKRVAVLEYGVVNEKLHQALSARGALVTSVPVYRWELPEDVGPLEANVRAIAAGERDVALFLSSQQVVNMLLTAERLGIAERLLFQLRRMVVASIGPTTSETLRERELPVDVEPEHAKMGHLVMAAAERAEAILSAKRPTDGSAKRENGASGSARSPSPGTPSPGSHPQDAADPPWNRSLFLRACRRETVERTPVWLMRQAGRYLPLYREIRSKVGFLDLCKNAELSAQLMVQTVDYLGVDAAIIFSDLLPILEPLGFSLEYEAGEGPVIHNPVRAQSDLKRVRELDDPGALDFVYQTVRRTRAMLRPEIPVIGFAGAPFTLASYAIEGGGSRHYLHTKSLMYRDEGAWHALAGTLARAVAKYLKAQIDAGAQAVQLFDSWAGCLAPGDYRRYVLPHLKSLIAELPSDVPVVNFATGNPALLPLVAEAGGSVIGLDWRISLADGWRAVGHDRAVQGNLDPLVLLAEPAEIRRRVKELLVEAAGRAGHVFNLGHGILPQTPPENVLTLIAAVREFSSR